MCKQAFKWDTKSIGITAETIWSQVLALFVVAIKQLTWETGWHILSVNWMSREREREVKKTNVFLFFEQINKTRGQRRD